MKTRTLLPLETFRSMIGFDPWHFWGWKDSNLLLTNEAQGACNPVLLERQSQGQDRAGREDIRQALAKGENKIAELMRWYPAPKYIDNDTIQYPRMADRRMSRGGPFGADWRWLNLETRWKYVQAVGVRALTSLGLNKTVNFLDEDGDGYYDVAVVGPITVPSTVTDIRQIALYFSATDRFGLDVASTPTEEWRVEPTFASLSGTSLTIRMVPWMLARPILYEGIRPQPLDPADITNFVSTLDVYQLYTDGAGQLTTDSQAVIIWETRPSHGWWCLCTACSGQPAYSGSPGDPAAVAQAVARVGIHDSEKGLITPAESVYNSTDGTWMANTLMLCEEPDRVLARYLAGYPLDHWGHMDQRMREIVTYLAAAELWRPVCGCSAATRAIDYLQLDLSKIGNTQELYHVSERVVMNQFGTRRGHVMAWERLGMEDTFWGGLSV